MRLLAVLLALVVLVAACDAGELTGGDAAQAMTVARSFLGALEAGDADTAWSLVYPPNREGRFPDRAGFDALVADIDLAATAWEVTGARVHDGHWHVDVRLAPLEVPPPLDVFIQVVETDGVPSMGTMQVDIEPFGTARGVLGG